METEFDEDGSQELMKLLETGRKAQIDENWAVATLSLILSEIAVTKKLEHLGEVVEETFEQRWERLIVAMKMKEGKTIAHISIPDIFRDRRGKFVHAGHKYKPTRSEMEWITNYVIGFIEELY